jgi:hypothetical protein
VFAFHYKQHARGRSRWPVEDPLSNGGKLEGSSGCTSTLLQGNKPARYRHIVIEHSSTMRNEHPMGPGKFH